MRVATLLLVLASVGCASYNDRYFPTRDMPDAQVAVVRSYDGITIGTVNGKGIRTNIAGGVKSVDRVRLYPGVNVIQLIWPQSESWLAKAVHTFVRVDLEAGEKYSIVLERGDRSNPVRVINDGSERLLPVTYSRHY